MAFWQRSRRGIALAKQSWRVLMGQKSLLLFPILSGIAIVLLLAVFLAPFVVSERFRSLMQGEGEEARIVDFVLLYLIYFGCNFAASFFNAGLVFCVAHGLRGERVGLARGMGAAARQIPQLFGWAVVNATVGVVLQVLRSRGGGLVNIVSILAGLAWSIATYFAVPLIVMRGMGPIAALRESVSTMRRVWGESLVSNSGIALVSVVVFVVIVGVGFVIHVVASHTIFASYVIVAVAAWVFVILVVQTLGTVLKTALYVFAVDGTARPPFDRELLSSAFASKRTPGGSGRGGSPGTQSSTMPWGAQ